jgi:hypothetical protein
VTTLVTDNAADLTAAGLAVIGIPAPEHGPRGTSFLDFFVFDDFNAFGNNFRQASIDSAAGPLIEGIVAGDGQPISTQAPRPRRIHGRRRRVTLCHEPRIEAALNFQAASSRSSPAASSLATLFSFAEQAGIPAPAASAGPPAPLTPGAHQRAPLLATTVLLLTRRSRASSGSSTRATASTWPAPPAPASVAARQGVATHRQPASGARPRGGLSSSY